jgi:hypothetical protein
MGRRGNDALPEIEEDDSHGLLTTGKNLRTILPLSLSIKKAAPIL